MKIVSIYIVNKDYETSWLRRQGSGRYKAVRGVNTMDPDYEIASGYLGVDRPTFGISIESSLIESEDVHEESLSGLDVFVHS